MTWFNANSDYRSAFAAEVDALWAGQLNAQIGGMQAELKRLEKAGIDDDKAVGGVKLNIALLFAQKNRLVADLTEAYVRDTGERPDARQLDRLATWLLKGAEGDDDFLTERVLRKRNREKEIYPYNDAVLRELDGGSGNKIIKPITEEAGGLHRKTIVRLPHDKTDKRKFNGRPRKT